MTAIFFGEEPWAVRLMPKDVPIEIAEEVGAVCPLIAVDGAMGLVVRQREMLWWPLERMRVIIQPEVAPNPDEPGSLGHSVMRESPTPD